jgi:hypothetical protein
VNFVFSCVNVYAGQCQSQSARQKCYNAKLQAWQAATNEWCRGISMEWIQRIEQIEHHRSEVNADAVCERGVESICAYVCAVTCHFAKSTCDSAREVMCFM